MRPPYPASTTRTTKTAERIAACGRLRPGAAAPPTLPVSERLEDLVDDLLGVAEQHHGVVAEEQLVLHAGVARAHAALDEQHRLRPVDVEDRHAEDRRLRIRLGSRVRDVVG